MNVSVAPSNVSSAGGVTNLTWTPFDTYQPMVNVTIYNHTGVVETFSVPNLGRFELNTITYALSADFYTIVVHSTIGRGNTTLNVYNVNGLNITQPNSVSIIYNDSMATPVMWTPFSLDAPNVTIDFINQNTFQQYTVSAPNSGDILVDLVALGIPAGSYNLTINSSLGFGATSMFVIRYDQFLNITSPNGTTNVSNVGVLDMAWMPTNPAGGNATIYLFQPGNASVHYGPFSSMDDGSAVLDLATSSLEKILLAQMASTATEQRPAATGLLSSKKL